MSRTILLANPWIYDFSAYDCWNKPLGLLFLASLLRKNGETVYYLDCLDPTHPGMQEAGQGRAVKRQLSGAGNYPKERIPKPAPLRQIPRNYNRYGARPEMVRRYITSLPVPDLVMITSMMTYWYPGVFDFISLVRESLPGVPVVLGGNYVTLCPEHAALSGADILLPGPAEQSLPSLFKELYNRGLEYIPDSDDLDSHPYPAFDLIPHPIHVPIMTSRGCPYSCSYCASAILNRRFLRRDPLRVADEITYWYSRLGIRHFSFYDDALLVDPDEMAIPLLKEIVRRALPVQFHCPNGLHLREVSPEMSVLLYKAGFRTIRFGFETADPERQAATGAKVDNAALKEAVRNLRNAGYRDSDIGIYLLCGLPGQYAGEMIASINFIHSCGARPIVAEYSPIPGTALWDEAVRCSPYPIAEEPLFQNNTLLPCRGATLTVEMYHALKLQALSVRQSPGGA